MNWLVASVTAGFVVLEGLLAKGEGTLVETGFPFLKHGGIWADFVLFSLVNGLVWKYLKTSLKTWIGVIVVSLAITCVMHWVWFSTQSITSWLWPNHPEGGCFTGMSVAGRMHVVFMTAQIAILAIFVISPVDNKVAILAVACLLTIAWPLLVLQPCWVITGKWLDLQALVASAVIVGATWGISWSKLAKL